MKKIIFAFAIRNGEDNVYHYIMKKRFTEQDKQNN